METPRSANLLGALCVGVGDRIDQTLQTVAQASGMVPAGILSVGTYPGQTIDDLRLCLNLSHSGTVRLVDRLVSSGLLERRPGTDLRSVSLHLTPAGKRRFRRMLSKRSQILTGLLSVLTASETRTLERILEKLLYHLPADPTQARNICRLCDHAVCRGPDCPVGSGAGRQG